MVPTPDRKVVGMLLSPKTLESSMAWFDDPGFLQIASVESDRASQPKNLKVKDTVYFYFFRERVIWEGVCGDWGGEELRALWREEGFALCDAGVYG